MDPYLEAPWIWPSFQNSLADQIQIILNQLLPKQYYSQLEARSELGIRPNRRIIAPDVAVVQSGRQTRRAGHDDGGVAVVEVEQLTATTPVRVDFTLEPITVTSVSVRDNLTENSVVTLIEILSSSNKRSGPDRDHYIRRPQEFLDQTATSLVEIDLLREGLCTWPEAELIEANLEELNRPVVIWF